MKKTVLAVLLVMVMVASLVACGSKDGEGIVGKWNFVSMEANGEKIDYKSLKESLGSLADDLEMYLDIKKDNTFVMANQGEETSGTWRQDGDKYFLDVNGDEVEAKINGSKLTMEQGAMKMEYEK